MTLHIRINDIYECLGCDGDNFGEDFYGAATMERLSHESTGPGPPVVGQDPRGDGAPPREANLPADAYTPYSIPLSGTLLQDPPRTSANVSQKGDEDGLPQASGEDDPTMDFEWFGDLLSGLRFFPSLNAQSANYFAHPR